MTSDMDTPQEYEVINQIDIVNIEAIDGPN